MKGQAFSLMVVMVALVITTFIWIIFNHVLSGTGSGYTSIGDVLYYQVNSTDQHYNIRLGQELFYYSLMYLIVLTFLSLIRSAGSLRGGED